MFSIKLFKFFAFITIVFLFSFLAFCPYLFTQHFVLLRIARLLLCLTSLFHFVHDFNCYPRLLFLRFGCSANVFSYFSDAFPKFLPDNVYFRLYYIFPHIY